MKTPAIVIGGVVTVVGLLVGAVAVWLIVGATSRRNPAPATTTAASRAAAPGGSRSPAMLGRKIKARLFYVSDDGTRLIGVEREIVYGDGPAAQAQLIISAQLTPVSAPLVSAIPAGTMLRALYLNTDKHEAYVDLSRDVATNHTGGSLDELLTVYTIVNALTSNLPAVTAVQVLVEGKEVDTLAGHVDLRRPLAKNLMLVDMSAARDR